MMIDSAQPSTRTTVSQNAWILIGAGAALATASLLLLFSSTLWTQFWAFLVLSWWLPGFLLALHWRLPKIEAPALALVAFGLGVCWMILVMLIVHWIPGPVTRWQLLGAYITGALILLLPLLWKPAGLPRPVNAAVWYWGLVLLVFALTLRLPGLGYHEFHADEVVLLRQGARAIEGQDDAFAEHTKGPGELALATSVYRALGTATETTARLPFGLISAGSVLALAWLGRRMFSPASALWAGLLLTVNGFALGLSRIAQYQPVVLLLSVLVVLAAWEFARNRHVRWLALAITFGAFGVIMHYEFLLLGPVLIYLLWIGWRHTPARRPLVMTLVLAGCAGLLLVGAAYVPAMLSPYFSTTQGYLANRLGGFGAFNLAFFLEMGSFYNSTYFWVGLLGLAAAGTALGWRGAHMQIVALSLWWIPYFLLYVFVIRYPGTHFYLLMESWSLLAALPLAMLVEVKTMRPALRAGLGVLAGVWLLVSMSYLGLMFFRQDPEYLINYETERMPFFWAPYPVPEKPRFGFPIQEGWKALGVLGQWGYLPGTYASNDKAWSLRRWYLTPFKKRDFDESPDYIFVARHIQDPDPGYDDDYLDQYHRVGEVRVRDEPRLEIWAKTPLPVPYVTYDAANFAESFTADVAALDVEQDPPPVVHDLPLGDTIVLESAHLQHTSLRPGETLHLLLVWRPLQKLPTDYKVFVHVTGADGRPVAQWDGLPGLNTARTSQWPVGEPFRDHVLLAMPDELSPGQYSLLAGLYDGATGERLGGQAISLATLTIR